MNEPEARDPLHDTSASTGEAIDAGKAAEFDRFELHEALSVVSHFDLGTISAVQEFRRGSRRSPKLLIKCDRGLLILKRIAPGRDRTERIDFAHELQRVLAASAYPLPRLIPARDGRTLLRLHGHAYELFECVSGHSYDHSLEATQDAGRMLALFHRLLSAQTIGGTPPTGSYHKVDAIEGNLAFIPHRLGDTTLQPLIQTLTDSYRRASQEADAAGLPSWPRQIIHGDWHPGNLLFRGQQVAAVIDYDTARLDARAIDIANGALQFSLTRTAEDPDAWGDSLDESRLKRFCLGYDSGETSVISQAEVRALPWLMIEAMIAESAVPIAVTGRFGRLPPAPILRMVDRKSRWIRDHQDNIRRLLA